MNCAFCQADTVYLKNGKVIEGKIVEETDDFVRISRLDFNFKIKYLKKSIKKIERAANIEDISAKSDLSSDEVNKNSSSVKAKDNIDTRSFSNINEQPQVVEKNEYIVYLPAGINNFKKIYPLVIIFHPVAKARDMIEFWRPIADENKFILYASKKFRNDVKDWLEIEDRMIREVCRNYPVAEEKVIATGLSGGGMGAHMYSVFREDLISAVITNVGRIHPEKNIKRLIRGKR